MSVTDERFMPDMQGQIVLEHLNRYYFVINQLDLKDKVVIDIASGEGYGSEILAKHSQFVYGVDISLETIEHSKKKYQRENLEFKLGDAAKIPLPDQSADVLVSFETIEHHDKHIEMLKEIKRVLKKDGILIISSPDKYYYSDLPNYNNEYHIKELYYDEFKSLISGYFKKTFFFGQRVFGGSIIALDEEQSNYDKLMVVEKGGENHSFSPIYNLAIATDSLKYNISNQVVLYTEQENVITLNDVYKEIDKTEERVKNTKTWKVGYYILYPFKMFLRIFSNSK